MRKSGNAITQSFMTLPSLIVNFPAPATTEYRTRSTLLGKQWPICWTVGNDFFRPISALSTLGYAFTALSLYLDTSMAEKKDWRLFALGALLHVSVIVHSAVNMQPLNDQLAALAGTGSDGKSAAKKVEGDAVKIATAWIEGNYYRIAVPAISGGICLYQTFGV
jgi:hypothetical protein